MAIAVIRIRGLTDLDKPTTSTLDRLRLRRKYACVLIDDDDVIKKGMIKSIPHCLAFGKIDAATEKELIEKRGQKNADGTLKPFFRLHPPRGGFKKSTKQLAPKGILGHNKEITKLLKKML